jgi:hypothetical protein
MYLYYDYIIIIIIMTFYWNTYHCGSDSQGGTKYNGCKFYKEPTPKHGLPMFSVYYHNDTSSWMCQKELLRLDENCIKGLTRLDDFSFHLFLNHWLHNTT